MANTGNTKKINEILLSGYKSHWTECLANTGNTKKINEILLWGCFLFEFVDEHGTDECVEGVVVFAGVCGSVDRCRRVGCFAELLLIAGFVVLQDGKLLLLLWVLEYGLDGGFGIV